MLKVKFKRDDNSFNTSFKKDDVISVSDSVYKDLAERGVAELYVEPKLEKVLKSEK